MRGRKPKVDWTPSLGQYATTIEGKIHRLGTDQAEAERRFRFLLEKNDLRQPVAGNPSFGEVADQWLEHVSKTQDPELFRTCKGRINDFLAFLGRDIKVRDIRPSHVEEWIASRPTLRADGTKRLYKAMILACLNWAASAKVRLIPANPIKGKVELPEGGSRGADVVWPQEVFDLVIANSNVRYGDFIRALAWTGARPSTVKKIEAKHYNRRLRVSVVPRWATTAGE